MKQQQNDSLRSFWNVLTLLAAKCEFREQTKCLKTDVLIQQLNNKTVQQQLDSEPKEEPEEALGYAVAFEEGISQQRSFGGD